MNRVYNVAHRVLVGGLVLATVGMGVACTHDAGYMLYNRRKLRKEFLAQQEAEQKAAAAAAAQGVGGGSMAASGNAVASDTARRELQ